MGIAKITINELSGKIRIISKDICTPSEDGNTITFTGKKIQDYLVFVVRGDKMIVELEDGTEEERVFTEDLLLEGVMINNKSVCEHCGHIHRCKGIATKFIRPELLKL